MEGGVAAKEGEDEFERLIDETPNGTYGNPQTVVNARQAPQMHKEVRSLASGHYAYLNHSPRVAKQGDNSASYGSLNFANTFVREPQNSMDNSEGGNMPINQEELNLPDDHFLTFALENLSIDHSISKEQIMQYYKSLHVHGLEFYGQHHPPANKFSSLDSADMPVFHNVNQTLQVYFPHAGNGMDKFNFQVDRQVDEAVKLSGLELKGQKAESWPDYLRDPWHRASINTGVARFSSGPNTFQFIQAHWFYYFLSSINTGVARLTETVISYLVSKNSLVLLFSFLKLIHVIVKGSLCMAVIH